MFFYDETYHNSQFSLEAGARELIKSSDLCGHIFLGCLTENTILCFSSSFQHTPFGGSFANTELFQVTVNTKPPFAGWV